MARVEKNQRIEDEVSHMKGDILKAVREDKRKGPGFRSCAVMLLVAIVVLGGAVAWVVASTGMIRLPIISSLAYEAPSPVRTVEPGLSLQAYMTGGTFRGSFADIPESTLTAAVRDALASNGQTWLDDHAAQAAKTDGQGIELFLPLSNNAHGTAIVAHVGLSQEDGKLAVRIDDISFGSLAVPKWIIASVVVPAIAPVVASLNDSIQ